MNNSNQKNRPYVGIIKSVIKDKGYGFIMIEYQKDIYFQLKECHIKDISPFTYVAFKKRISQRTNRIEAYDIKRVSEYKKELLDIENDLLLSERDLIYYCNKDLSDKVIEEKTINDVTALRNINDYINAFNITEVIESYQVVVEEGHIYKPGDDDTAMVYYVGSRTRGGCVYEINKFPQYESLRDVYIDNLLPEFHETIFHERAFCPWEDILAGFGDLTEYREKAIQKTQLARKRAFDLYDKEEHKRTLVSYLNNIIHQKTIDYKASIERSLQGSLSYGFELDIKLQDMKY